MPNKTRKLQRLLIFVAAALFAAVISMGAAQAQTNNSQSYCDQDRPQFCDTRRFPQNNIPYAISYSHWPENGGAEKLGQGAYLGQRERDGIREALKMWSDVSGITFEERTDALPAGQGIIFGWTYLPEFILGRTQANWYAPNNDVRADIVFNLNLDWTQYHSDNYNGNVDYVSVAAHEIGHALGLVHSSNEGALMFWRGYQSHRYLHPEDISRIQALYPKGGTGDCVIPPSGAWPPCATGGSSPAPNPGGCVIPPSGPWPPCATGGSNPAPNPGGCVIPPSGAWPPCATGGSSPAPNPGGCVIPPSGPWPPCARYSR